MLSDIFPNAPQHINQEQVDNNTILVWANGEFKIGFPANIRRFLAYTRNGPWLKPFCGPKMEDGRDMSAVIMETNDGRHVVINAEWSFNSSESHIRMEGDGWKIVTQTQVASFYFTLSEEFMGFRTEAVHCEPWVNDFGYCTWNSLGVDVDHQGVVKAVDSLAQASAPPRVVIIDDGWQVISQDRRLESVFPRKDKFPQGFRGVVDDLKSRGVDKVFVWSSIIGYWEGFANDLGFATCTIPRNGNQYLVPSPEGVYNYYETFFSYLSDQGVYGVKLDTLNVLDDISDQGIRRAIQDSYMKAVEYSSNKYRIKVIWSMGMVPYIFDWFAKRPETTKGPFRNSDDFFPQIIDSHFWHNYCNIYNSQFTRQFGHSLDFDMFQTKFTDPSPGAEKMPWLHAATRAISGGPIYITDYIGAHDPDLINCLVSDGKALRFPNYPTVEDPYQCFDDDRLVVAHNQNRFGRLSAYLNFTKNPHSRNIEVPSGYVSRAWKAKWVADRDGKASIDVQSGEWELISTVKIATIGNKRIGCFGLIDKFAGLAALNSVQITDNCLEISCLPGSLGLYLPDGPPEKAAVGNDLLDIKFDGVIANVDVKSEQTLRFWF
ncbi:putative galactinol--sucrose galactosyltransferase 6 [Wickerhamiella sorbophila]|uniref:Putative galactinol--sucrose galactosyltransferase 6 n=1 Tax=Wickerhamiella sorbophila TaxID=45607 RepID=A0A2T0FP65_9ASCO|nr:putative galactinol--sucrose galactosyltransferase 6 [Wickerhamiella sorbophila]PRT56782.1 putative galactinol--sucrose galactosyltransferase 6 [Wickerhamiella sorbophila]